jgi:hypothetical protein
MGRPSRKAFEDMLQKGWLLNNPVTLADFKNAIGMYGEDLGVLKGKTVRKKTDHVKIMIDNATSVDARNIVLSVDLMYKCM